MVELLLRRKELSVGVIAKVMGLSYTATSRHLGAIANVDILEKRQEGLTVYYRVGDATTSMLRDVIQLIRRQS